MSESVDHLNSGRRLEALDALLVEAGDALAEAELDAARKGVAFKTELARKMLAAPGSVEIRKAKALVDVEAESLASEVADAVVRGCRAKCDMLRERVAIAQSLNATARGRMP